MQKLHLVMPMGGKGSRFSRQGYDFPKPLLEIRGKPFFYWSVQSVVRFIEVEDLIFVVLREHMEQYGIDRVIRQYYPNAIIHCIPEVLNGAVLTCLEGVREISDTQPVLFNDCDHIFRCTAFERYCKEGFEAVADGALLTFWSNEDKYSYLKYDCNGNVTQTVEKKAISNDAICGCYFFRNRSVFEQAAKEYLTICSYAEFFVSGVYNVMAGQQKVIRGFRTDFHVAFGTPEEYEEAQKSAYFSELE